MKGTGSFVTVLVMLVATGSVWAHHSFSPVFDASKKFMLTGTLTKVDWRNPHIAFVVEAPGERAQSEEWMLETEAPKFFQNRNLSKTNFQKAIGQTITVEAYRARDGSRFAWIQQIALPDGTFACIEVRYHKCSVQDEGR
jgi:hypothetical protein